MPVRMWSSNRKLSVTAGGNANWYSLLEDSLTLFNKLSILSPYEPALVLFCIYPNWKLTSTHKPTHSVYISFTHCQTWRQPKCPSIGEWLNCGACIQWSYYWMIKINELLSHRKTRNSICILLSESIQSAKSA